MKKIITILLLIVSVFTLFACGKENGSGSATEIEINYWNAGLGKEFFEKIVEEFEKEYPEYTLKVNYKEDFSDVTTKISLGAKYNSVDLYFGQAPEVNFNQYLEPLNGILDLANKDETLKVGEKIDSYLLETTKSSDGNYYSLPYGGGICGIVYNNDLMNEVLESNGMKIPNTTDELRDLTLAIQSMYQTEHKPFIHFKGGYWGYITDVWQAQYDGIEEYEAFYRLGSSKENVGTKNETPDLNILLREDGRYEVLKVLESLLSNNFVVSGSNSSTHTDSQTKFINGSAVMMVNGAWMVNEMKGVKNTYTDFRVMKTPVISSIINKCETIESDEELSALIDAIDSGSVSLEGDSYEVSEEDFNRIKDARNLIWQVFSEHGCYIPSYASAKEGAKEFIKFYFSDKAQKIFNDLDHIALPFKYDKTENEPDISSWTNFEKDMYNLAHSQTMLGNSKGNKSVLFTLGGLMNYPAIENNTAIVALLSRASDNKTAQYIWNAIKDFYTKNFDQYMSNARLK